MPGETPLQDPALATARVVEGAVELARAEARLALAHARVLLVKTVAVLLAVMLTTAAMQVSILLVALFPVLLAATEWSLALAALAPAFCLTGIGAWLSIALWRELRNGFKSMSREES